MKFCPRCGTELILRFESGRERPVCPQCGYVVYRNPAPVGLIVATRDDKLLLVHRTNAPLAGYWAPPAGYIEIDESVEEGIARETKEETGLDVTVDKLLGLYSRANVGVTIAVFAGRVVGGEIAAEEGEVSAARFFARDELPVQAAPATGTALDLWFHEIVETVFKEFREAG
jgi:NADH pyrophosphatase NudC (nudix superfamily)